MKTREYILVVSIKIIQRCSGGINGGFCPFNEVVFRVKQFALLSAGLNIGELSRVA